MCRNSHSSCQKSEEFVEALEVENGSGSGWWRAAGGDQIFLILEKNLKIMYFEKEKISVFI